MDGCWRESGEGDWEAGVAGVIGLAWRAGEMGLAVWSCRIVERGPVWPATLPLRIGDLILI